MAAFSLWSHLPWDLAQAIIQRLDLLDQMSFAAVCTHWRGAIEDHRRRTPREQHPPWLLLAKKNKSCPFTSNYLCIPADSNPHILRPLPLSLPSRFHHWRIVGSSHGWLFMLEGEKAALLNPLTGASVNLPDIPFRGVARKAIISCPPTSGVCFVAVLYNVYYPSTYRYVGAVKVGEAYWVTGLTQNHLIDMAFMGDGRLRLLRSDAAVFDFRIVNEEACEYADPLVVETRNPFMDDEVPTGYIPYDVNVPVHLWRGLFHRKNTKEMMAVSMCTPYRTPTEWSRPRTWRLDGDGGFSFIGRDRFGFLLLGEMGFAEHLSILDDVSDNVWRDRVHDIKWNGDCGQWTVFSMADGSLLRKTEIRIPTKTLCSCGGHMAATWFLPDFGDHYYLNSNSLSDKFGGVLAISS